MTPSDSEKLNHETFAVIGLGTIFFDYFGPLGDNQSIKFLIFTKGRVIFRHARNEEEKKIHIGLQ